MTEQAFEKTYHIYFKDGNHISFTNFFQFYFYQENIPKDKIDKLTVEELWVDMQKQCMEIIQKKMKKGEMKHE